MTVYYVDYEFGNDTLSGTSFANRKQTIQNVMAVAAFDDIIRVKESMPDRDAGAWVWSKNNTHIWINSNVTAAFNVCDTAWTANTSVTSTQNTTIYIIDNATDALVAAAANPGRLIHGLTEQVDYSNYRYVNLSIRSTITLTSGQLQLKLCSDTGGATPVHTLNIPSINVADWWHQIVLDPGANLNSSIQSVALYQTADLGEFRVNVDNIFASKPNNVPDHITIQSFIKKAGGHNKEPWYPVRWILNGPTVGTLGFGTRIGVGASHGFTRWTAPLSYATTTEQANLLVREAIVTPPQTVYYGPINELNVHGIRVTGGWNRTDMSSRNSTTFFSGAIGRGVLMNVFANDVAFENMQLAWYADAIDMSTFNANISFSNVACHSNDDTGFWVPSGGSNVKFSNICVIGNYGNGLYLEGRDIYIEEEFIAVKNERALFFIGDGMRMRDNGIFNHNQFDLAIYPGAARFTSSNSLFFQSDNVITGCEAVYLNGHNHRFNEISMNDYSATSGFVNWCTDTDIHWLRSNAIIGTTLRVYHSDRFRVHNARAEFVPASAVAFNVAPSTDGEVYFGNTFASAGIDYMGSVRNRRNRQGIDHRQGARSNLYSEGLLVAVKELTPSGNASSNITAETSDIIRFVPPSNAAISGSEYVIGMDMPSTYKVGRTFVRASVPTKANLWIKNGNNFQNNCGIMVDGFWSGNPTIYSNATSNNGQFYDEVFVAFEPVRSGPVDLKYVHYSPKSASNVDYVWAMSPGFTEINAAGVLNWLAFNPVIALGLRKLNAAYQGSAVRIRRSSDSTEQDIGFTANGHLDYASFSTFVGGGNGFVAKWYDQSGAQNHAIQETTTLQPMLRLNIYNERPCLTFHGANSLVIADNSSFKHAFLHHQAVVKTNLHTTVLIGHAHSNTHVSPFFRWCMYHSSTQILNIRVDTDNTQTTLTPFAGQLQVLSYWNQHRIAYANGIHQINGTDIGITYNSNIAGIHIGENGGGTERMVGDWIEYIMFKETLPDYSRRFLTSNQGTTFGVSITGGV